MNDMFDDFDYEEEPEMEVVSEEYPLPDIVQDWVNEGSNFTTHNDFALTMLYFNILGQIVKDFISIPVKGNRIDSRVHFVWMQTARTGKTAAWKFVKKTLNETYEMLNALNLSVTGDIDEDLSEFSVFSLKEYTEASLIGTIRPNKSFDSTLEEDDDNLKFLKITGGLEGSGIAHWDEFESSGIFKTGKHKENILMYFQTFMNSLDSESYIISKRLADTELTIECDCQRSLYATTYVPENLVEVIINSGVLQRAFIFVREVPDEIAKEMRNTFIDNIGNPVEVKMPVTRFAKSLVQTYMKTKERWESVNRVKEDVIEISDATKDVIRLYYNRMDTYIRNTRPEVKRVSETFIMNLLLYQVSLSALIAISNRRFKIVPNDVHCAGRIVENAYKSLVEWLEQALRTQRRQSISDRTKPDYFRQAYMDIKNDDGWVHKTNLIEEAGKLAKMSKGQVYRIYKNVENQYEAKKIGKSVYLKMKEEYL